MTDRDPVSHRVPGVSGTPRDPVSHPLGGDTGEHAPNRTQSVSPEECLMCGMPSSILVDLEAAKSEARRLRLQLNRLRAKHSRFARETGRLITELANDKGAAHS